MKRFDRLIGTLLLLQSRKVIRARDIAAHFHVSIRTVYRDLRSLEEAGVPLAAEAGDGFRLVAGYNLPPVMFSNDEAISLITGMRLVTGLTGDSISNHATAAIHKILSILPSEIRDNMDHLSRSMEVIPPDSPFYYQSGNVLSNLQEAIINRNPIDISYRSESGSGETHRVIEPLGLFFLSGNWHLVAWCRLRNDYRNFRVDRIQKWSLLAEIFSLNETFNLKSFIESQSEAVGSIEFSIRTDQKTAQFIRQRYGMGIASVSDQNGVVTITYLTNTLEWVPRWLLGFGSRVRVISPPELINHIQDELIILNHHYGGGDE